MRMRAQPLIALEQPAHQIIATPVREHELAAGSQHALHFDQRVERPRDVVKHAAGNDEVELCVGKWELLCPSLMKRYIRREFAARDFEHGGYRIHAHEPSWGMNGRKTIKQGARSAAHIE
ncbi:hypothetical protein SSPSH_001021 [Salinisphaera shabanensis E1L3A]|uniref:Uncharacterized protein n=1 Tax=Salinisphaera shabanensis E1L3A TaxID=1033802 RepID=U2E7Z7_9GAMM|nr:hypothetical protein SSPSH_001021 [Salinisphaera shabanensis E1L3A]